LRELLEMMSVTVIPEQLSVARANAAFDTNGRLVRDEDLEGLQKLAAALAQAVERKHEAAA
jgi:NAD(P)H-dependent FMN reductase